MMNNPRGGSRHAKGGHKPKPLNWSQGQFAVKNSGSAMGGQTVKGNQIADKKKQCCGGG